ncbi:MAG: DUF465 domain-containing protein [Pseudomonadota bacterium]
MALEMQLEDLVAQHRSLEQRIADELSRPYVDGVRISELKKQKLRLKDRIEQSRSESDALH